MPYKNPEDRKRRARERAQANPEGTRERNYAWRRANPERWAEIQAKAALKRTESGAVSAVKKTYYARNTELLKAKTRQFRITRYEQYLVKRLEKRAKEKGLPFDLVPEDIVIPETCPVLGIPLLKDVRGQSDNSPSADRLVPSKGYVRGNVRIISKRANQIKNCATIREVELVLAYMKENIHGDAE